MSDFYVSARRDCFVRYSNEERFPGVRLELESDGDRIDAFLTLDEARQVRDALLMAINGDGGPK